MDHHTRSATEDTVAEHIPWEQLTVSSPPDRSRLLYGVAAILGLAVIGVVVGRALRSPAPIEPLVEATVATEVGESTVAAELAASPPAPAAPSTPDPLSEADLLAVVPVPGERAAAARAEWFIIDYFGVDGASDRPGRVARAAGWSEPLDPLSGPVPATVVSYVEWAVAALVEQVEPDEFEVTVVFRRYVAADGSTFARVPTEAARVRVRVDPVGGAAVLDWPVPVDIPQHGVSPAPPGPPPGTVTDAAGVQWPVGGRDGSDQSG